jgi:hypothetical protein
MTSALFSVGASSAQVAQVVAFSSTTPLAIVNTSGIDYAEWSVVGQSHADLAVTITPGAKGLTATITFPADPGSDRGVLLECKANGGKDSLGRVDPSLICRRVIGTTAHGSQVPYCANEEFERDAVVGWAKALNSAPSLSLNSTSVNITETPISGGSGTATLWSRPIAESTDIEVDVRASTFSTASGKRWTGTLTCTAKRAGAGALTITSQAASVPWILDDSLWSPIFDTSGDTLRFRITADATASIVPRGSITFREVSTSSDPAIPALPAARAAVVADGYAQLYFADTGLTPSNPSVGTNITAWADQSGHNRHLAAAAGDEPRYALDGSWPYLDLRADVGAFMIEGSGLFPPPSDMTFRWTIEKTDNGTASIEILTALTTFWVFLHNGNTNLSSGTSIALPNVGTVGILAACPTGKHDIELRLNRSTFTATLYIDGVLSGTKAYADFTPARYPTLGYTGSQYQPVAHIYAWAFKDSLGTDAEMTRWITFSQLAFGAHD